MSCLEVNTSGQFPICKFFTFSVFHFWHQGFSFLCYQEELETTIHWILGVLKISGRAYEPSRQTHRSVSLRVWSMVGVPPFTYSRVRIIISIGSIRSGRLSASGLRPMRISLRRISKTWVGWQGLLPMSLSAYRRISLPDGWRLAWRWRFRSAARNRWISSRCCGGGRSSERRW